MTQAINPQGGMKIQGMINEFICKSSKITAGEFVNYINELSTLKATNISTIQGTGDSIHACELRPNRVFIVHKDSSNYSILDATLVSVENNNIVQLKNYTIYNSDSAAYNARCIALDESRVFVTCGNGGNFNYLVGFVVTVTDTEMQFVAPTILAPRTNTCYYTNLVKIADNKVLIIHNSETNEGYISGLIVNFTGTTFTSTTSTVLLNTQWAAENMGVALIDTNKVFVAHGTGRFNTNSKLGGFIVTISGDTLTASQDQILIDEVGKGMYVSACALGTNKVLISHAWSQTQQVLGVIAAEINGTQITVGKDTQYAEYTHNTNKIHLIAYSDKEAILAHYANVSNGSISGMIIGVEGLDIAKFKSVEFNKDVGSGNYMWGVKLSDGRVFFAHRSQQSAGYLSGLLTSMKKEAKVMTTKNDFYGVATQTKSQGQAIKVAMPKV